MFCKILILYSEYKDEYNSPLKEGVAKRIFKCRESKERKVFAEKIKNDCVAFLKDSHL